MSVIKKTILLSNKDAPDNNLSLLVINRNNAGVFGNLKVYKVPDTFDLILGLSVANKQILKQNVNLDQNGQFSFKLDNNFNLNEKIGCVLVAKKNDTISVISWGSNSDIVDYKNKVLESFDFTYAKKNKTASEAQTNGHPVNENVNFNRNEFLNEATILEENAENLNQVVENDGEMQELGERVISLGEDNKFAQLFDYTEDEVEKVIDKEITDNFYFLISEQIDELFAKYPSEKNLENIVENSKWVKVDFEEDGRIYVIGLIYVKGEIKYICYGVPGEYSTQPPQELENYSQWLPTNLSAPYEDGYWVMYQDALTGEPVSDGPQKGINM